MVFNLLSLVVLRNRPATGRGQDRFAAVPRIEARHMPGCVIRAAEGRYCVIDGILQRDCAAARSPEVPAPGAGGTNDTPVQERHARGYGNSISVQYLLSIAMISTKFTNVTGLSR